MSWSKITTKTKKPIGWWYHKIMCEVGWWQKDLFAGIGYSRYYYHLNKMIEKYGLNLYGEVFKNDK